MTNTKEGFHSRKGLKKIFSKEVIGFIILLISLFFITGFYSSKPESKTSAEGRERLDITIVEDYVSTLKKEGYESVFYDMKPIVKYSGKDSILIKQNEKLEDTIIGRYNYYATYYVVEVENKDYWFKSEELAINFIRDINKYERNQYQINKKKELVKKETSQNEINEIIESKKRAYKEAVKKAKLEAEKKAEVEKKAKAEKAAKEKQKKEVKKVEKKGAKQSTTQSSKSQSHSKLQEYAHDLVINKYGWSEYDFDCLVKLWNKESGWNPNAHNKSSGAHGIPQSLPASKMASEGSDYYTNGETQIRWGLKYIKQRYGSPSKAWAHSQQKNWY